MKRDAGDSPLGRFRGAGFPVADDGVADGGKLHADLVLQSRDQFHPNQSKRRAAGAPPCSEVRRGAASLSLSVLNF